MYLLAVTAASRSIDLSAAYFVQTATFEADLALSHRVTHAEWLARPLHERVGETLASLLGTQL